MSRLIYQYKLPIGLFEVFDDKPELVNLIHTHQTHSADIVEYNEKVNLIEIEADGILYRNYKNDQLHFAIKTADCLPIIILGENGFCFIHAGWAGLKHGILKNPILRSISPTFAFIGPSISLAHFEVQPDFREHFPENKNFHLQETKLFFNLKKEASDQLRLHFPSIQIVDSEECTFSDLKYNSYRRDKTKQRNWNIFSIEYNYIKKDNI